MRFSYNISNIILLSGALLLQIAVAFSCKSETIARYEKFTIEKGLRHNFVICIHTDSRGFLWVGTKNGLQRFDGYGFKTYILKHEVAGITETPSGELYIITTDMILFRCSVLGNGFTVAVADTLFRNESIDQVKGIHADAYGHVWVATRTSLIVFDPHTHKISRALNNSWILSMQELNGAVYAATPAGLFRSNRKAKMLLVNQKSFNVQDLTSDKCHLWLLTQTGVVKYDPRTNRFETFVTDKLKGEMGNINRAGDGKIYITTNSGLLSFDPDAKVFEKVVCEDDNGNRASFFVFAICYSEPRILWLATYNGLIKVNLNQNKFRSVYLDRLLNRGLPITVRCVAETGCDTFWVGTWENGLYRITYNNTTPQVKWHDLKSVTVIREDTHGDIWIGTNNEAVFFDTRKNKFSVIPGTRLTWDIIEDHDHSMWFATRFGELILMERKTRKKKVFRLGSSRGIKIWQIFPYADFFLLATDQGLHYFSRKTQLFDRGWKTGDVIAGKLKQKVWHIDTAVNSRLYISTQGDGLKEVDLVSGKINTWHFESDNFYGFEKDHSGCLWLVEDAGVIRFDPRNLKFKRYGQKDGLISNSLAFKGNLRRGNGEMVFAGENGFSVFNPEQISDQHATPKLQITSLKIAGTEYADYIGREQEIVFGQDQNQVAIEFAVLDFRNPSDNLYSYFMKGVDEVWNEADNRRFVSYQNLSPGKYIFYMRAAGSDGYWSDTSSMFRLTITPPLWQRWWFILLLVAGVIVIGVKLIRYRLRALKDKYRFEQAMLESEIKTLRSQINPHFIFNALNAIQHFVMKNEKAEANIFLGKFSSLIRKVLDYSSLQSISVYEESELLSNYLELESLRFEERLTWRIDIDASLNRNWHIPTLLIQPLVENAVVHGISPKKKGGEIIISFYGNEEYITCSVKDSGVGLHHRNESLAKTHHSKGISLLRERMRFINKVYGTNGSIEVVGRVGADHGGTEAVIRIPSKKLWL